MTKIKFHWERIETTSRDEYTLRSNWDIFQYALVGHLLYVFRNQAPVERLFTFNLKTNAWDYLWLGGTAPFLMNGISAVLVHDKLLCLGIDSSAGPRLDFIYAVDLVAKSWERLQVYGRNLVHPCKYHVSDLWEDRSIVLINTRDEYVAEERLINRTYILDLKTNVMHEPKVKGSPPTRRWLHSSYLDYPRKQWYIFGGERPVQGLCNDIYWLDFNNIVPTWSRVTPFVRVSGLRITSLCAFRGKLVIIGGARVGPPYPCVYDLRSKTMEENSTQNVGKVPEHNPGGIYRIVLLSHGELLSVASTGTHRCHRAFLTEE